MHQLKSVFGKFENKLEKYINNNGDHVNVW